mgnify:CR=1 FL=1
MGRQIRKSKGKTMKPNFFVFCEGESEVAYISHLRSQYRAYSDYPKKERFEHIRSVYRELQTGICCNPK